MSIIPPATLELKQLSVGSNVAEHEAEDLNDYFVETPAYERAFRGPATVLVGRRGSGKTAIMFGLLANVQQHRRDHATKINPAGYEIDGLVNLLDSIEQRSVRGFLIESLWKYLIYSEIALSVEYELTDRTIYQPLQPHEDNFLAYCNEKSNIIKPPFSERLHNAIQGLSGIGSMDGVQDQRMRVSEQLHDDVLGDLRKHIGAILGPARKLLILIDNLDRPWNPGPHIPQLAELIGGLLAVIPSISQDMSRSDHGLTPVNAEITVLLRSDIFAAIRPLISEPDKLPLERLTWDNPGLLMRVLDERLLHNAPNGANADELWAQVFPSEVSGMRPREYILRCTLPRPRDLIHFVTNTINIAKSAGQDKVLPQDMITARRKYSDWLYDAVLVEDDPRKGRLEAVLISFAGAQKRVSSEETIGRIKAAGVDDNDVDHYINLLCDIGLLGIARGDTFEYPSNETDRSRWRSIAEGIAKSNRETQMYEIHSAFRPVLGISD